jgi:hypothetical protein
MAPQALREDSGLLDRRCEAQIVDHAQGPNREAPRPPLAFGVVFRFADHLDDAEDGLPNGRVEDREVMTLHRRPLRGRVGGDTPWVDAGAERLLSAPSN